MRNSSRLLRAVLCAALVAASSACDGPTSVNDQLDVTLTIDRTVITPGSPANVTVVVRNRGRQTVEIAPPQAYSCFPPYDVLDARDTPVTLPGRYCLTIGYAPYALAPGASVAITDVWSGDASDGSGNGATAVAPGKYRIRARVTGIGDIITGSATTVSVVSAVAR